MKTCPKVNKKNTNTLLDLWWLAKKNKTSYLTLKHNVALDVLNPCSFPLVDLGCGTGVLLKKIEKKWPRCNSIGVEASNYAIKKKICKSIIISSDIHTWVPTQKFQTGLLIDVLEHIQYPAPLLTNISKYCSYILLAVPNFNFLTARIDMLLGKIPFQNRPQRGGHIYWCNYLTLKKLFTQANLVVKGSYHLYPRTNNKFLRYIYTVFPSLFAHEFIFLLKS